MTEGPLRLADQRSAPYTSASAPTGRTQGIDIDGVMIYSHWIFLFVSVSAHLSRYLLTPWSRVLLEKLTGSAASQEIPHIL